MAINPIEQFGLWCLGSRHRHALEREAKREEDLKGALQEIDRLKERIEDLEEQGLEAKSSRR